MKKIIFILLLVVSIVSFSQTSFQCTKTIDTSNCKLRFFNANSVKIFELNLATTTYTRGVTNEYIIKDGLTQVTIPNNGCLTTPTFANLASFIDGARFTCSGTKTVANLDTTQQDTAIDKHVLLDSTSVRIINDSIKVYFTQPLEVSKDTTHQAILSEIKELLTVINSRVDTTQQDTSLDKSIKLDSTLVRIINDTLNVRFIDSTYYTQLDSIKYYLSQNDSIEICFDTITFQTYVTNLPTTICNGDSAVRVQLCNVDSTLNAIVRTKIDTTNAILYRIENKASSDTTHEAILRSISDSITTLITATIRNNDSLQLAKIIDSLTNLSTIVNELKSDCIGSNETYYINGTNTITLNASEVCSYTVTVIEEKLQYSENGVTSPFDLPVGYTGSSSFKNGSKFLINQVSFTGTTANSKAIIKIIK